ncbi:uncharacterized protein LOC131805609 isoform X3 [Musca domestica]|uniref:Uncharacterized protein LOC131805609 isoform X3 n=1 Tax=Musca domestica TaxID=7370 RepID=A0ABM3VGP6_MUSDO|nr:uncharacterized protein LOC131805609 isoform X3 [Musca domestica]
MLPSVDASTCILLPWVRVNRPNYSIVNGKAFTEDNVLVYNIFVYNIPQKTTERQILDYFKKFGEIKNVRLINDRKRKIIHQAHKIGFVNFMDPTVAAKVLQDTNHCINKKRIRVRACDSWHQPDAQAHSTKDASGEDVDTKNSSKNSIDESISILNLNDDCLELIFKHLPMKDKIQLARSCSRLRNVFEMHSKIEYKRFALCDLDNLTLWQTRQFLEMAGPQIERLDGPVPYKQVNRIMEFLGLFCTNVKTVCIDGNHLKPSILCKLLRKMTNVETLELNDTGLCDFSIPVLKNLPGLKSLSLNENCELTGKYIKELKTISSLSLNGCRRLTSHHLLKICESLTELHNLELLDCPIQLTLDFSELVKHLSNLETLKINTPYSKQSQLVATLPKLKHLTLCSEIDIPASFFEELVKHQSHQLESLFVEARNWINLEKATKISELKKLKRLSCQNNELLNNECLEKLAVLSQLEELNIRNCSNFSERVLLDLIKSCPKLHTLDIRNCKHLKESFANDLLKLLKAEQSQCSERKPLCIFACRSDIDAHSIANEDFKSSVDLLKLKFDFQFSDLEDIMYETDHDDYDDYYGYENEDMDFLGMLDDDDDDYYMYFSDNDDADEDEMDFNLLREALYRNFRYGGDAFF